MLFNCYLLSLKKMSSCFTACGQGQVEQADTACVFRSSSSNSTPSAIYITEGPWGRAMPPFLKCPSFWGLCASLSLCRPLSMSPPFSSWPLVGLAWGLRDHQSCEGRTSWGGVGVGMAPRHPPPPPQDPSSCSSFRSGVLTPSVGLYIPVAPTTLCSH